MIGTLAVCSRSWLGCARRESGRTAQLNPGLLMRPDYEVPVKAVVDYLEQRDDVNPKRDRVVRSLFGIASGCANGCIRKTTMRVHLRRPCR